MSPALHEGLLLSDINCCAVRSALQCIGSRASNKLNKLFPFFICIFLFGKCDNFCVYNISTYKLIFCLILRLTQCQ